MFRLREVIFFMLYGFTIGWQGRYLYDVHKTPVKISYTAEELNRQYSVYCSMGVVLTTEYFLGSVKNIPDCNFMENK